MSKTPILKVRKNVQNLCFVVLFLIPGALFAQLSGIIRNEQGEVLPYATVFVKGTTVGSFSNEEGEYSIKLQPGENTIVFQYVGYAHKEISLNFQGKIFRKDIVLETDNIVLNTVTIFGDAEDPAYAIIRKAIKAKDTFKDKPENYKAKVYQKFQAELLDAPEQIMGIKLAENEEDEKEIEEMLDTSKNVLFVMESVSELLKGGVGQSKETILSSRISGNRNSYSSISSELSKLNFYNNSLLLGRQMLSPIASNALLFYDYKLMGNFMDEGGNLINKIKVIPKGSHSPVFSGFIFIVEDTWNIHSLDLYTGEKNTNIRFLDEINIKQKYRQLSTEKNSWALNAQYTTLGFAVLGFKVKAFHTKNITDYLLNQRHPEKLFDRILVEVDKDSNKQDSVYWENIRPIPLSVKEKRAYHKMDSIEIVTSSKSYLDSIDRRSNRFSYQDLWGSYTYRNRFMNYSWTISSPIPKIEFHPVLGFHSDIGFRYNKTKEEKRFINIEAKVKYGTAAKKILPSLQFNQLIDNRNKLEYSIDLGRAYVQPGEREVMSRFINSLTSLIQGENYIDMYQQDFLRFLLKRNFIPGIKAELELGYTDRTPLENTSNYMFPEDLVYAPNIYEGGEKLKYSNKLNLRINLSYRPGTKYIAMPDQMIPLYSAKPTFYVEFDKAFGLNEHFADYDFLKIGMRGRISAGILGYSNYHLEGGSFLSRTRTDIIDDRFFQGNERYYVKNFKYREAFHLLPYYQRAGFNAYSFLNLDHHLNGLIVNKIPFLRKLKIEEVVNVNVLYMENEPLYYEFGVGVDRIFGFASLRYSWGFMGKEFHDRRLTFSFNMAQIMGFSL